VNVAAVVYNWSSLAACVIALSLSLTVSRRTRFGRPSSQLALAACVIDEGVELINFYTRASWAPYLFCLNAPILFAVILAEVRSRRVATAR
jgi:hypothetical protein